MTGNRRYDVWFKGEVAPHLPRGEVIQRFGARFGISRAALPRYFQGRPLVLKAGVDAATARNIQAAVTEVGAVCHVRPARGAAPTPTPTPAPPIPTPAPKPTPAPRPAPAPDPDDPFIYLEDNAPGPSSPAPASPAPATENPFVLPGRRHIGPPPPVSILPSVDLAAPPPPPAATTHPGSVFHGGEDARRREREEAQRAAEAQRHRKGLVAVLAAVSLLCFSFAALYWERHREIYQPPGVLIAEDPTQIDLSSTEVFLHKGYGVQYLAEFQLRARVLGYKRYDDAYNGVVMPLDLALGWGVMSDSDVLKHIRINQYGRFYFWRTKKPPVPLNEIRNHSANMHMVPADDAVWDRMKDVRTGHCIALSGYLVTLRGPDGAQFKSSLRRTDSGPGACEIIWVESFEILP